MNTILNPFTGTSLAPHRFAARCLRKLHALKERVTAELSAQFSSVLDERRLQQMINEADALAAATSFPALFLPDLAEEKVRAAANWQMRQRQLFEQSPALAA
jgi:hypothetical protein